MRREATTKAEVSTKDVAGSDGDAGSENQSTGGPPSSSEAQIAAEEEKLTRPPALAEILAPLVTSAAASSPSPSSSSSSLSSPSLFSLADSCDKQGESLLGLACSLGLDQAVFLLLQAGAYVDAPGARDGATPLLRAAGAGNANVVKALIAMGADAAAVNAYGEVRTGEKRETTFVSGTIALIYCRFCIFFALCCAHLISLPLFWP